MAKKIRQQEKKKALAKESSESGTEENDAETLTRGAVPSFPNPNIHPEYSQLKISKDFHHPQISPGFHSAAPSQYPPERSEISSPAPSC